MKKLFVLLSSLTLAGVTGCGGGDNPSPVPVPGPSVRVQIGTPALPDTVYKWTPSESLDNSMVAQPFASPKKTTTYTVEAITKCGSVKSNVTVRVYKKLPNGELTEVK